MSNLITLQKWLENKGLDGFLVPMADQFQSEYVPSSDRRLEWLTGFSGSAGSAIILSGKAAFFTDSRYTLQASEQVDNALFERYDSGQLSPGEWLKKELDSYGNMQRKIAYDPWLYTENSLLYLKEVADKNGVLLVALEQNPIDELWIDRPDKIQEIGFIHQAKYSGQAFDKKIEFITKNLESDIVIITLPESVCWLLNLRGNALPHTPVILCYAMVGKDGLVKLFASENAIPSEAINAWQSRVSVYPLSEFVPQLQKIKNEVVQIDPVSSPIAVMELLQGNEVDLQRSVDPCLLLKSCKNDVELEGMRNAHIRDGVAMVRFLHWLEMALENEEEITEISASDQLEKFRSEEDYFRSLSFDTISGYGAHGAIIHYRADDQSNAHLKKEGLYLLDSGGQYLDGTTDITRTLALGTPTIEQKKHFTLVLKGHIALDNAVFPKGTTGSQLDILARQPLWSEGLDYGHGTGHGVGHFLGVHEGPQRISKHPSKIALQEGMVLSNEPGFYLEGQYGIRIENLVAVASADLGSGDEREFLRFETLTLCPIDISLVDMSLLTSEEVSWLNSYHAKTYHTLSPLLGDEDRIWLRSKTKEYTL